MFWGNKSCFAMQRNVSFQRIPVKTRGKVCQMSSERVLWVRHLSETTPGSKNKHIKKVLHRDRSGDYIVWLLFAGYNTSHKSLNLNCLHFCVRRWLSNISISYDIWTNVIKKTYLMPDNRCFGHFAYFRKSQKYCYLLWPTCWTSLITQSTNGQHNHI